MIEQVIPQDYCLGCKGCCRFSQQDSVWLPVLLREEIEELLEKNFSPSLIAQDKKIHSLPYPEQNNFICSFFKAQDNKCKIYAFRPFQCQLYPFLINRKGDSVFLAIDLKCPFVQENLKNQKFKRYSQDLTELLKSPNKRETLKNNPQIIQAYEGALNLAELNP